jgi:hypothetical protein
MVKIGAQSTTTDLEHSSQNLKSPTTSPEKKKPRKIDTLDYKLLVSDSPGTICCSSCLLGA